MTRLVFPHERLQLGVARLAGRPAVSLAGQWRTIYTDLAHTALADIRYLDLSPIPLSRLQLDDLSRIPEFYGPDGAVKLYDDSGNTYFSTTTPLPPTIPIRLFFTSGAYPARPSAAEVGSVEWVGPSAITPPEARAGFDTWIKT